MYFPILRARQFELIALRELAIENSLNDFVVPVIEPVKKSINGLNLANNVLVEKGQYAFLILNPLVGESTGDTTYFLEFIDSLKSSSFRPAFHYQENSEYITSAVQKYGLKECMLVCTTFNDSSIFRALCAQDFITHIMVLDPHKNRSVDRYIKTLAKAYIRLDDLFEKQTKNADFLEIPAHKFSEEHLFFSNDGYKGFADYTVLPSEFIEGGSTPRAVVIHLTYLNEQEEKQIWIRHFTSITNDSIVNVQGKFAEAANKALLFCESQGLANSAINELRFYFSESKYPGLGTVKKISIKNHLLIVHSFLSLGNA